MALPKIDDEEVNITTKSLALKDNKNLLVGGYVATDQTSSLKIFISDVNVDIKGENPEPENPGEGIEELTSSLLLYPNPVKDKIYIETPTQTLTVEIYDVYGRHQVTETPSHQGCLVVDVTDLKSGVYFVKVITENGEAIKRIIKN